MRNHLFPLLFATSLLWQSASAATPELDSGGVEDLTNAITGEIRAPAMKEPAFGVSYETNMYGDVITITNEILIVPQKANRRIVPEVRISANGAEGIHPELGHSIEVDGNLNRADSVVMHLPATAAGSVTLQGHAIGIGLTDAAGHQAWLGQLKDCSGEIDKDQPNVIRWPDAFTGIRADVVFIYGQSYIEQLVVLKENPVIPEEIDQATARLYVMSEFFQTPEPRRESRIVKLRDDYKLERKHGPMVAEDEILDWGWMRMAEGKAFVWQKSTGAAAKPSVYTAKSWQKNGNRVFLLEYADYLSLKPALDELAAVKSSNRHEFLAHSLPQPLRAGSKRQSLQLAKVDLEENGVVLDFRLVNSALINVNFGGDNKSGAAVVGSASDYWNSYVHPNNADVTIPNLAWNVGSTPSQVSLRVQNGPGHWGFTTTDPMYWTYIYPQSGGNITLTISNLPTGDYDFYIYGHGGAANQNSTFTIFSNQVAIGQLSTSTATNWQQSSNWIPGLQFVGFTNGLHFNAGDVVTIVSSPNASTYAIINGLQISAYNQSPVAWAGVDQSIVLPGTATLTGTVTDDSYPPNRVFSNTWSKASGYGTVTLNPQTGLGSSLQTTASFGSPGAYGLRFTSSDSQLSDSNVVLVTANPPNVARDTAWVEDALPRGSTPDTQYDVWNWVSSNPTPLSGNLCHQSTNTTTSAYHYFLWSNPQMHIVTNDWLFCYVYLEADKMPGELMLMWLASDSTSWHRAYWGTNVFTWMVPKTHMGDLPPSGRWVRLSIPASAVGLEGRYISGMFFGISKGRATWDLAGKSTGSGFADADGDGLRDSDEVYIFHTDPNNASNADSDGDGLPDVWENYFFGNLSQTGAGDWDGDGISNAEALRLAMDPAAELGLQMFTPVK